MKALIDYISGLTVTQGKGLDGPFPVLPWQRRFLHGAFADEVEEAALSVGRGNGKTTLCAAIAAACLDGPLVQARAEVVLCAASFDQAKIAFDHVLAFLEASHAGRKYRIWDSPNVAQIRNRENGVTLKCIGCNPKTAHGLAPVLILADEPAQWEKGKSAKMRAALVDALGKIEGGRFVALGTRPEDPDNWFSKMLEGEADYSQTHKARVKDPPFHVRTWKKANPSLAYMPWLMRSLKKRAAKAKINPEDLAAFRALRLNQGVSDTVRSVLIEADAWRSIESAEILKSGRYALGIDLGQNAAMSGAAAYWPETGRLDALACFPENPSLQERGLSDGVGNLYVRMEQRGELIQAGGRVSDIGALLSECLERWGTPGVIVCDRWRDAELKDALDAIGFPMTAFEERGQGYKDGGEDVRMFRKAVEAGHVRPERSLLLRAAMGEARVTGDPSGNWKLAKSTQNGRRRAARDDAAAASILAVAAGERRTRRTGQTKKRGIRSAVV